MNFLAHIYLSGIDDELLMLGNFMGDFVKGSQLERFPKRIQQGIYLHRQIDSFTDAHTSIHEAKQIFRPLYGRYSGVICDIVFDHFLSIHWAQYSKFDRRWFIYQFYNILRKHHRQLPPDLQKLVPSLIHNQWVMYYASLYGTQKVLQRMSRHTSLPEHSSQAIELIRGEYAHIDTLFMEFFPQIILQLKT